MNRRVGKAAARAVGMLPEFLFSAVGQNRIRQQITSGRWSRPDGVTVDIEAFHLAQVARLYWLVLQVVPDGPGLQHHADRLSDGLHPSELARTLLALASLEDGRPGARLIWERATGRRAGWLRPWKKYEELASFAAYLVASPLHDEAALLAALFPHGIDPREDAMGPSWAYRLWSIGIDAAQAALLERYDLVLRAFAPLFIITLDENHPIESASLDTTIRSLQNQSFGRWRLILNASPPGWASPSDPRIVIADRSGDRTHRRIVTGRIRAGDLLAPHALAMFALACLKFPDVQAWQCDEDRITDAGIRHRPKLDGEGGILIHDSRHDDRSRHVGHLKAILVHRPPGSTRIAETRVESAPSKTVSIVIATKDRPALLKRCVDSILSTTGRTSPEVVIVDNGTTEVEALELLAHYEEQGVVVLRREGAFNWSALCNAGVAQASGDILIMLNNDIECIRPGWIEAMVDALERPDVGIVGARLIYADGEVQHAGVVTGPGVEAAHWQDGGSEEGQAGRYVTAVTGACMAFERELFDRLDGFDENLPVTWNDLDFCLRARKAGYAIRVADDCILYHDELGTRSPDHFPENQDQLARTKALISARHGDVLGRDPFFHPFLLPERGGRWFDPEAWRSQDLSRIVVPPID